MQSPTVCARTRVCVCSQSWLMLLTCPQANIQRVIESDLFFNAYLPGKEMKLTPVLRICESNKLTTEN